MEKGNNSRWGGVGGGTSVGNNDNFACLKSILSCCSCLLFLRCLFAVSQENHTSRAILILAASGEFPARFPFIRKGCTIHPPLIRAVFDFPAGSIVEELFDPFDTDFFCVDQLPYTAKPFDVILSIQPVPALPSRENQTMLFVQPQCLCSCPDQFCRNPHRVEGRILVFKYIQAICYHTFYYSPRNLPNYQHRHLIRN